LRNFLSEEIEVNVKFMSPQDRGQWEQSVMRLPCRRNLSEREDYDIIDSMFTDSVAVRPLDSMTLAYTIPPNSLVETRTEPYAEYIDEVAFKGNSYDKKFYYNRNNKLKLYNNKTKETEKVKFKIKGYSWMKYFFDIR